MADKVRVFVSHHHSPEEDAFTARLVAGLTAAGADVWVDTGQITSGDFIRKINEGLAGRQWLVLVMTPASVASPWVQREVNVALNEHAAGRMLGVLPIVMQPCREVDIPMMWRTLHRHDATHDYQEAISTLVNALGLSAPPTPATGAQSRPTSAPMSISAGRFPVRLASLGYAGRVIHGVEVIAPPLCLVPVGWFLMGSDPTRDEEAMAGEVPQRWVELPEFQIARYPVTVAEYACFVRIGHTAPNPKETYSKLDWDAQLQRLDHPVVYVSWHDAVAYALWLSKVTGQLWRLPTEVEWEKAARWDLVTHTSRVYPWGDQFDASRCNSLASGKGGTMPIGSYSNGASPCGAQDIAGNVWEWTSSMLEVPDKRGDWRVMRGGSWLVGASYARAARTIGFQASSATDSLGFRLVLAVSTLVTRE